MSKLSGGASYLTQASAPAKRLSTPKKSPVMVAVSAFFALLVLFMSVQPLLGSLSSASPQKANAAGFEVACTSKIGLWMDDKSDWSAFLKVYPQENEKNRVWTLQEAFGNGATFVNYEGEGKGPDKQLVIDKSPANTFKPGNYDSANVQDKLNGARTESACVWPGFASSVANVGLWTASAVTNLVQAFVVFAFDSSIICEDPANPSGVCLNLLKVVGGSGSDPHGGLIGTLTSSIYMPLLVIAVTITGFWVGYKGLVQRKLREAMFGAIWVCLSVIFGLALLLNPALLAKAPMAVSNSVASCVIGSFNGQNCMDSSTGTTSLKTDNFSTSSDKICRSIAPGASLDAQMSMTVNSLSCSIWKAFVLEPYAQGSFGTSFESLDTIADTPTKKVIEKAGIDPNTFCVNLGTSDSLASFSGKRAVFDKDTGKVCNLLAYQMFLKTNASTTGSDTPSADKVDSRWYNVVVTAANDEGLWAQWAPTLTNSMHKNATATLAIITSVVGGFILVVIAFFALVYYLTSVILMAFAPLFFLMGTHPGRGKKIMLGWLEKVISNVLKYIASAIFLIVSISFYSAILGAATNPALTFLFVIIISGALFMYRKEIIELIGKASMGGEQLSSKFADGLKDRAKGVGGLALAGAGSGIGAAIAGGRVTSGIKAGIQRDLQRGGAKKVFGNVGGELVGNATRQFARSTVDNERDIKNEAKRAQDDAASAAEQLVTVEVEQDEAQANIRIFDNTFKNDLEDLEELNNTRARAAELEDEAAREMMTDDSNDAESVFASAQKITNMIAALNFDKMTAVAAGDTATADNLTSQIQTLALQRESTLSSIDPTELQGLREDYSARVSDKMFRAGIDYTDTDEKSHVDLVNKLANAQVARDNLVDVANELTERRGELENDSIGLAARGKSLSDAATNIQPGDMLTQKKADKIRKDASDAENASLGDVRASQDKRVIHEKLTMDEVYEREVQNSYRDSPAQGPSPRPFNDDRGPSDGPDDRGPSDGSGGGGVPRGDGPRPAPSAEPTRPLPTSPVNDSRPTEPIATQPDRRTSNGSPAERGSGLPTVPTPAAAPSDTSAPASNTVPSQAPSVNIPEASGRVSTPAPVSAPAPLPDRAPTVQAQPVQAPSAPSQSTVQPVRETVSSAQPVSTPRVPTQPAQAPSVPAQPAQAPSVSVPAQAPTQPDRARSAPAQSTAPPVRETVSPAQPASIPRVPTQPAQAPSVPAQPAQAPSVSTQAPAPAQPDRAPSAPVQPASPRVPVQPAQASSAPVQQQNTPAPASAPAAPVREPRVPTQPAASPRVPTQPAQAPSAQTTQAQAPQAPREEPRVSAPQPQAAPSAPPAPNREPSIPAQPNREPNTPMVRDRGNRGAPMANEIRLPSSPQVSRVTENSPTPSVSVNRAEQSDNQSGTRRGGIPRRRTSRND
jgi:hypothetical protein